MGGIPDDAGLQHWSPSLPPSLLLAMKFFAFAAALALVGSPVAAQPEGGVSRDAYGVRQCKDFDGSWGQQVCYNTKRTGWISVAGVLPVPITRTTYRSHTVDCRVPHPGNSLRAQVAQTYCPQLPGLAPAPFLTLND